MVNSGSLRSGTYPSGRGSAARINGRCTGPSSSLAIGSATVSSTTLASALAAIGTGASSGAAIDDSDCEGAGDSVSIAASTSASASGPTRGGAASTGLPSNDSAPSFNAATDFVL